MCTRPCCLPASPRPARFLSAFKWEPRKGWDVLLEAYLSEFAVRQQDAAASGGSGQAAQADDVELYIITKPFVGGRDFKRYMHRYTQAVQTLGMTTYASTPAG